MYPIRGAVTFKSTVGTNVASDALANLASGGVHRRRADHRRRGLRRRLLDHAGAQPRLCDEIADLAARSAAEPRIDRQGGRGRLRAVGGVQHAGDAARCASAPATCTAASSPRTTSARRFTLAEALENPRRDTNRIVLPPASYLHEKEKIEKRWPAAVEIHQGAQAQRVLRADDGDDRHHHAGRHVQRRDARAAALGLADVWGDTRVPLYVHERHLSAGRRRDRRLLRGQEGGADGRGRPARTTSSRPSPRCCARRDIATKICRQGRAADGRRIYRRR